jgi:hypothetical protein
MQINAWINNYAVRSKKTEREVIVQFRATEEEIPADEQKKLTSSVTKDGVKCKFTLTELTEDKTTRGDDHQFEGRIRNVGVRSTVEGRFIQIGVAIAESEVTGSDLEFLVDSIRSGAEPSLAVVIVANTAVQMELVPGKAVGE